MDEKWRQEQRKQRNRSKRPVRGKVLISRISKGPQVVSAPAFCAIDSLDPFVSCYKSISADCCRRDPF